MIRLIADVIGEAIEATGNPDDFVGHVGGDDFVALTTPDCAHEVARYVTEHFDHRILDHYRPEDLERGYVELENRRFQTERFPLVSVTIALVESDRYEIDHIAALNDIVAGLKKRGKQMPGSVVVCDQRLGTIPLPRTGSDG